MKFHRHILAFLLLQGTASAFMPLTPQKSAPSTAAASGTALNVLTQGLKSDLPPFPTNEPFKRIQGGGTVMTWPMPTDAERVEMMFRSSGRPMKVTGEFSACLSLYHCLDRALAVFEKVLVCTHLSLSFEEWVLMVM